VTMKKNDEIHTHKCELGHQLRSMKGVRRGENRLSVLTCEEIEDNSQIEVDGNKRLWSDYKKEGEMKNWKFQIINKEKQRRNITKFKDCWNKHGKYFAEKYEKLYGSDIKFEEVVQIEKIHFILCLDDSGSMQGKRWDCARTAAINFINGLISSNLTKKEISIIIFNSIARIEAEYMCPNKNLFLCLQFKGGATDFGPPFEKAFDLIYQKPYQFQKHIIIFYTDGEASYPFETMDRYLQSDLKRRIELISICEDSNPSVLKKIVSEFDNKMGGGILKTSVNPSELIKVLPELLDSKIHR